MHFAGFGRSECGSAKCSVMQAAVLLLRTKRRAAELYVNRLWLFMGGHILCLALLCVIMLYCTFASVQMWYRCVKTEINQNIANCIFEQNFVILTSDTARIKWIREYVKSNWKNVLIFCYLRFTIPLSWGKTSKFSMMSKKFIVKMCFKFRSGFTYRQWRFLPQSSQSERAPIIFLK